MKISRKSFNTKLYRSTYGWYDSLPISGCEFLWKSLLAWVLMIPAWPGHLINLASRDKIPAWTSFFHVFAFFMFGGIWFANNPHNFLYTYCVGGIIFVSFSTILILLGWVVIERENTKIKRRQRRQKRKLILIELYKTIKEKICPKIEWID